MGPPSTTTPSQPVDQGILEDIFDAIEELASNIKDQPSTVEAESPSTVGAESPSTAAAEAARQVSHVHLTQKRIEKHQIKIKSKAIVLKILILHYENLKTQSLILCKVDMTIDSYP